MATEYESLEHWLEHWRRFCGEHHDIRDGLCTNRGRHQNWPQWNDTIWRAWQLHTRN